MCVSRVMLRPSKDTESSCEFLWLLKHNKEGGDSANEIRDINGRRKEALSN